MNEQTYTQDEANQFIIECHFDLETVKRKLAAQPELVRAYNPETIESALGAAGHIGRADIAEVLLANGAELELAAAAMLGRRDVVRAAIEIDPQAAFSGGAHNIPLAFHVALSGDSEMMQMLWDAGAQEPVRASLHGAVIKNRVAMAKWLLQHGASMDVKNYEGKTPLEVAQQLELNEMVELLS